MTDDLRVSFRSMASEIRFWVVGPTDDADAKVAAAREVVERVAASCTRFDPQSALMQANEAGRRWQVVPSECFAAIRAAYDAHEATDHLFDPRVLRTLTAYGYDRSLPFGSRSLALPEAPAATPQRRGLRGRAWKPRFDADRSAVRIGDEPIDLGGIGKGLAVRWAADALAGAGDAVLIEAGGDVMALGGGPDRDGWMIAVENPVGGDEPVAVLRLTDRAAATSSTRVRSWTVGEQQVHHIVDPRTGASAQADLRSVTVVGDDTATAEVWSKSLFVVGRSGIRAAADSRGLAALWVEQNGRLGVSRAMRPYVAWQVSHAA
ncbi:MAG: FAD:protein FMN transferase [Candidatus Nanopelagicales bacterium]